MHIHPELPEPVEFHIISYFTLRDLLHCRCCSKRYIYWYLLQYSDLLGWITELRHWCSLLVQYFQYCEEITGYGYVFNWEKKRLFLTHFKEALQNYSEILIYNQEQNPSRDLFTISSDEVLALWKILNSIEQFTLEFGLKLFYSKGANPFQIQIMENTNIVFNRHSEDTIAMPFLKNGPSLHSNFLVQETAYMFLCEPLIDSCTSLQASTFLNQFHLAQFSPFGWEVFQRLITGYFYCRGCPTLSSTSIPISVRERRPRHLLQYYEQQTLLFFESIKQYTHHAVSVSFAVKRTAQFLSRHPNIRQVECQGAWPQSLFETLVSSLALSERDRFVFEKTNSCDSASSSGTQQRKWSIDSEVSDDTSVRVWKVPGIRSIIMPSSTAPEPYSQEKENQEQSSKTFSSSTNCSSQNFVYLKSNKVSSPSASLSSVISPSLPAIATHFPSSSNASDVATIDESEIESLNNGNEDNNDRKRDGIDKRETRRSSSSSSGGAVADLSSSVSATQLSRIMKDETKTNSASWSNKSPLTDDLDTSDESTGGGGGGGSRGSLPPSTTQEIITPRRHYLNNTLTKVYIRDISSFNSSAFGLYQILRQCCPNINMFEIWGLEKIQLSPSNDLSYNNNNNDELNNSNNNINEENNNNNNSDTNNCEDYIITIPVLELFRNTLSTLKICLPDLKETSKSPEHINSQALVDFISQYKNIEALRIQFTNPSFDAINERYKSHPYLKLLDLLDFHRLPNLRSFVLIRAPIMINDLHILRRKLVQRSQVLQQMLGGSHDYPLFEAFPPHIMDLVRISVFKPVRPVDDRNYFQMVEMHSFLNNIVKKQADRHAIASVCRRLYIKKCKPKWEVFIETKGLFLDLSSFEAACRIQMTDTRGRAMKFRLPTPHSQKRVAYSQEMLLGSPVASRSSSNHRNQNNSSTRDHKNNNNNNSNNNLKNNNNNNNVNNNNENNHVNSNSNNHNNSNNNFSNNNNTNHTNRHDNYHHNVNNNSNNNNNNNNNGSYRNARLVAQLRSLEFTSDSDGPPSLHHDKCIVM